MNAHVTETVAVAQPGGGIDAAQSATRIEVAQPSDRIEVVSRGVRAIVKIAIEDFCVESCKVEDEKEARELAAEIVRLVHEDKLIDFARSVLTATIADELGEAVPTLAGLKVQGVRVKFLKAMALTFYEHANNRNAGRDYADVVVRKVVGCICKTDDDRAFRLVRGLFCKSFYETLMKLQSMPEEA